MQPVDFPEKNFTFNKPSSMTDDQCGSLPVHRTKDIDGFPVIISKWKLSPEELAEVARHGHVYLNIYGQGMPPVSVYADNPFTPPPTKPDENSPHCFGVL